MGIQRENGYSAHIEGFFVFGDQSIRLAKTNGSEFTIAESCECPPGTVGELVVIIDADRSSRPVILPHGISKGQTLVAYEVAAPF